MMDGVRRGVPVVLGNRRVLHPGRLRWLRALSWAVALVFLIALAFGTVTDALGRMVPAQHPVLALAARCAGVLVAVAVYAVAVRVFEGRPVTELAPKPALASVAAGVVVGVLLLTVVMAVLYGTGLYDVSVQGPAPVWASLGNAVEAGVIEELMVRGVILRLVWRAFGPCAGLLVSSSLFGAGHLANPEATVFAAVCIALEAGLMLGAFYVLTGRLWVSIGVHVGWNVALGYLFGAAVSGAPAGASIARSTPLGDAPAWLTGGPFGPEASAPALVVCTAVGALALWCAWRAGRLSSDVAGSRSGGARAVPFDGWRAVRL